MNNNLEKFESIVLGGGCFWCLDAVFQNVKGIEKVVSGYAGGNVENPTYEQVSTGKTGHAEVAKIFFDPEQISLSDILHIFFSIHDPTTLNRQGADVGTQYRSIILYNSQQQRITSEEVMREIAQANIYDDFLVTELKQLEDFYPAEDYHQKYYEKNPEAAYCQIVVAPKVAKFRSQYQKFIKS